MEQKDCWLKEKCNQIDCNVYCLKFYKLNYFYDQSLLSDKQREFVKLYVDADGSDKKAFNELKIIQNSISDFVWKGDNLYIYSQQAGNGKTSWSIRMLQKYLEDNWFKKKLSCIVLFINVPRYLLALKDNIDEKNSYIQHIKKNVYSADLVVWDDIGNKQSTTFEDSNLLAMIDARLNDKKSNIFTSNLDGYSLHNALGDRLYSRVFNNSRTIELVGTDKRSLNRTI